jgi:ComF family protein
MYPRRCVACGRLGSYLCSGCRNGLVPLFVQTCPVCGKPAGLTGATHPRCLTGTSPDGLISFYRYGGPVRRLITGIKYRGVTDMTETLWTLMTETPAYSALEAACKPCRETAIIVPVPLSDRRRRERGFNQSEVLARLVGERLKFPVIPGVLDRVRPTATQVSQKNRAGRLGNVALAFAVPGEYRKTVARTTVFLVDDVATTGATARAAAAALKAGGARYVWAVTVAQ